MNPFHATPSSPRGLRGHRRAKTHPSPVPSNEAGSTTSAWDYEQVTPTAWLWTSPAGLRYLVHPDGTTTL